MATRFLDPTIVGGAAEALDLIGNILEASTEYSIIGQDRDGNILLWNEGARRLYGYEPEEVLSKAKSDILYTPEDIRAGKPREIMAAERHTGPIHLLMTDVVMPGLGGRELAERLRAMRPDIRVLFLSGYTDDAVVRHGVLQETVHFLQKPFAATALAWKVREVLGAPA